MNRITRASGLALLTGLALDFGAPAAHADFTLEERIEIGGALKFANMSGRTVTTIAGDRSRTESELKMESKLIRMFVRDTGPTAEIVRLDQERVYSLELKKKEYTERTFAEMRAAWEKSLQQAQQAQAQAQAQEPQASGVPVDQSRCEWSEPRAEVRRSGEKSTFGGYEGERTTIIATQSCTDKETGSVCDFALTIDQWLAPGFPAEAEAMSFYKAYAEKMGLTTALSRDAAQRAESLFAGYKGLWSEVGTKMRDVKGYPLKTTFGLSVGGPKCQTAQSGGGDGSQAGATPPTGEEMQEAAATAAGETAGEVAAEKAGESAFGGIAGKIGGKIAGSLFGKKKKEEAAAPADATAPETTTASAAPPGAPPTAAPGMLNVIGMSVELVSLKRDAASPSAFEIPAGFKKVTAQQ
jgi:hypothetical protein